MDYQPEPLMTHAAASLEAEIDDMNAEEDAAGLNDDREPRPIGECSVCNEPTEIAVTCDGCDRLICPCCYTKDDRGIRCFTCEHDALDGDEHGGYPDMDAASADERTELLHRELREAGR